MTKTVVLITGATSGIGQATAQMLAENGFTVYGTGRQAKHEMVFADSNGGSLVMLPLDVTDDDSAAACIKSVMDAEGRIDVLINNAGYGIAGAIEDTTVEEMQAQLATNLMGTHRMIRLVLPIMRAQRSGRIINLSSVAGFMAIPYQAFYSVSKYGIEGYTRALRSEVAQFGIKVTLVQPGDTKTGFTGQRKVVEATQKGAYSDKVKTSVARMAHDEQHGASPDVVAKIIMRVIKRKNPPVSATFGIYKLIKGLQKILPEKLVAFALRKIYA